MWSRLWLCYFYYLIISLHSLVLFELLLVVDFWLFIYVNMKPSSFFLPFLFLTTLLLFLFSLNSPYSHHIFSWAVFLHSFYFFCFSWFAFKGVVTILNFSAWCFLVFIKAALSSRLPFHIILKNHNIFACTLIHPSLFFLKANSIFLTFVSYITFWCYSCA